MPPEADTRPRPLCVDLDGTLVRSDLLIESIFALLKRSVLYGFPLFAWLLKGKAHFKQQIAERVDLDASLLPYHGPFLEYLKEQRAAGRRLVLATASNRKHAEAVADYLGIFDEVLASDGSTNLAGARKLDRLRNRFGDGNFDYAANGRVDIPVWAEAGEAIIVNSGPGVRAAVEKLTPVVRSFDDRSNSPRQFVRAMRPHQWLKNLLVFVPLVLAQRIDDPYLLFQAALAFVAFGLCASSVYLLNDFLDLPADRAHPTKRNRPFAAGRVPPHWGVAAIPILLAASAAATVFLPIEFGGLLLLYYITTLAYSLRLKTAALIDVLVLAGLYTLRIVAGAAAVSVDLSFWLLAFSMFLFLSLALVKRYTECLTLGEDNGDHVAGRGYYPVDLETLAHFGGSSGYMSVLVLAFYINSEAVTALYARPEILWLLCPLLLYLVSRIWLLARRDQLHEDPMIFLMRDRRSLCLSGIGAALLWAAN